MEVTIHCSVSEGPSGELFELHDVACQGACLIRKDILNLP